DGERSCFDDQHRSPDQFFPEAMKFLREVGEPGGYPVIGHNISLLLQPKLGKLRQYLTLVWNDVGKNTVESRNSVGGDNQKFVAKFVDVANLAAVPEPQILQLHSRICRISHSRSSCFLSCRSRSPEFDLEFPVSLY